MKLFTALLIFFELSSFSQTFFRQEISQSDFRDITILQAVQSLQRKSRDIDKLKQGFNYVFTAKALNTASKKLTLSLTQLPLFDAIKYTAMSVNLEVKFERNTVILLAAGEKLKNQVVNDKLIRKDPRLLSSLRLQCKNVITSDLDLNSMFKLIKEQSKKSDPNGKGVNILNISGSTVKPILGLNNISVYEALRYTAIGAGITMEIDRSAIIFKK